MDLRFIAVVMVIAIIMDMLGRMARKRAAEQQIPPAEEWDVLRGLAEGPEPPGSAGGETLPVRTHRVERGAGQAPIELDGELPFRDRSPRPGVVRSREPRPVEQKWALPEPPSKPPDDAPYRPGAVEPVEVRPAPVRSTAAGPSVVRPRAAPTAQPIVRRARRTQLDDRLGLGTIGGLRRALVAREVLGPPVALRGDGGERKRG